MSDAWFEALGEPVPDERREAAAQAARDMGVDLPHGERGWIDRIADAIEQDKPDTAVERSRQNIDLTGAYRLLGHLCVDMPESSEDDDADGDEPADSPFDEFDRRTLEAAVNTWGVSTQLDMAVEECAEFVVAVQHHDRDRADADDVLDEVADLRIMVEQLSVVFGEDAVRRRTQQKMDRLRERLADEGVYVNPDGGDG